MKKIILILIIFLCSGCLDYTEINSLGIISGIAVEKKDNNYEVTYEVVNTKNNNTEETTSKTYTVTSQGKTFAEALQNTNKSLAKEPYFSHIKVVIIDKNVDILDIADYILREDNFASNFYLAVSENPKDILEFQSKNEPINSVAILNLLETSNYVKLENSFDYLVAKLMSKTEDITIPEVYIDNEITLGTNYLYQGTSIKTKLDNNTQTIYNYLTSSKKILVKDNTNNSIYISNGKLDIKIKNNKILLNFQAQGLVNYLNDNSNFRNKDTYTKLENTFNFLIKEQIIDFINLEKENNIDVLGLRKAYYLKYPNKKYQSNILNTTEIEVNTNITINRAGSIFEVIK